MCYYKMSLQFQNVFLFHSLYPSMCMYAILLGLYNKLYINETGSEV